jgi:hypothetical protein
MLGELRNVFDVNSLTTSVNALESPESGLMVRDSELQRQNPISAFHFSPVFDVFIVV